MTFLEQCILVLFFLSLAMIVYVALVAFDLVVIGLATLFWLAGVTLIAWGKEVQPMHVIRAIGWFLWTPFVRLSPWNKTAQRAREIRALGQESRDEMHRLYHDYMRHIAFKQRR